jgi:hypothetical protein
MAHTLTLELPDAVYRPLVRTAEQTRRKPDQLAVEWLAVAVRRFADDPLEKFIGAIQSDVPDWADRHDYYLGQALLKEMRDSDPDGEAA